MSSGRQLGLLWGSVAAILVLLAPLAPILVAQLPVCPFLALTGLPCLGCGSGRAAVALAAGAPWEALRLNPLAALGWTVLVAGGLAGGLAALAGREPPRLPRRLPLGVRLAVVAVAATGWLYLLSSDLVRAGSG